MANAVAALLAVLGTTSVDFLAMRSSITRGARALGLAKVSKRLNTKMGQLDRDNRLVN